MIDSMSDVDKAVAAGNKNGRKVVGSSGPGSSPYSATAQHLVPKEGGKGKGGGPDIGSGTAAVKPHSDRMGASYRVKQTFPAQSPQAQATQANGKIIPPAHRAGKGFWSQAAGL